ncbi:hypothetical protein GCM10007880_04270 [Mesorhizobium amorphae]|nr:hypothetical protein GCM10007880_04270 [Mesorhizobium amorphae]
MGNDHPAPGARAVAAAKFRCDVAKGKSVKAVGNHALFRELAGQAIELGKFRPPRVEGRIEASDLESVRQKPSCQADDFEIDGLVDRGERLEQMQGLRRLRIKDGCFGKILSAMDDPVTDLADLT